LLFVPLQQSAPSNSGRQIEHVKQFKFTTLHSNSTANKIVSGESSMGGTSLNRSCSSRSSAGLASNTQHRRHLFESNFRENISGKKKTRALSFDISDGKGRGEKIDW
jgi:hypothetical protein